MMKPLFHLLLCAVIIIARIGSSIALPGLLKDRTPEKALNPSSTACDDACTVLADSLPSALYLAKTGNFEFWDTKQSDLTPICRVEPSSSEEVSLVLRTLIDTKCHFAIKGGGHDRTPGSSNADGGVTIDLVRLNQVQVAQDRNSVKIGAGSRWQDVYAALEKEGLMVLGGRVASVGVGGLTLGGGLSFFINRYGLVCDSVLSYEIVLPNTSIDNVSQSSNPYLYRSLRGAGASNFGIVTHFLMESFSPSNPAGIWGGSKFWAWEQLPELLRLNYDWTTKSTELDPDVGGWINMAYLQAPDLWFGGAEMRHTAHTNASAWPQAFQPFEQLEGLPGSTSVDIKPLSNITLELFQGSPNGNRNIYGTFTYRPSVELEEKILDMFREEVNPIKNTTGFLPALLVQPISRAAIQNMKKRGGNALGIADKPGEGPLVVFSTSWTWKDASDDERSYAAYYRFFEKAEETAKAMGVWHPYKYINYAEATQDVWSGAGKENLRELRRVQRKVDPDGVFTKGGLASGYFKLNERPEAEGKEETKESGGDGGERESEY